MRLNLVLSLLLGWASTSSAIAIKFTSVQPASGGDVKIIVSPTQSQTSNKLDLLMVVDDSGSMDPYQQNLAAKFPALAQKLQTFSSVQVGVITTSMSGSGPGVGGQFIGTPSYLTSQDPNFVQNLVPRLMPGTLGDGFAEQPLMAAMKALSSPLIDGPHKGFLRSDAMLGVVLLTDEDDQSSLRPAEFVNFLKNLKGSNYMLVGLLGVRADQPRLVEVLSLSSGKEGSIANSNYDQMISEPILNKQLELERTIHLPFTPIVNTLQVKYGAQTLVLGDVRNGFVYDSLANAILIGSAIDFSKLPIADLVITFKRE